MTLLEQLKAQASRYGIALSAQDLQRADAYLRFVLEYNARTNLTADADLETLYLRHLADGFPAAALLARLLPHARAPRIADLGAGGGFIGMAVKLCWPEAEVTLIESLQRKFDFLNLACLRSGLKGLRVVKARAGSQAMAGEFDAVVARALAPLPEALSLAVSLLKPAGLFLAYQSEPPQLSDPALEKALVGSHARFVDLVTYQLSREKRNRYLAAFRRGD